MSDIVFVVLEEDRGCGVSVEGVFETLESAQEYVANNSHCYIYSDVGHAVKIATSKMSPHLIKQSFLTDLKALLKQYDAEMMIEEGDGAYERSAVWIFGGGVGSEVPYFDAVLPRSVKADTKLE